ncbi:hypothetical protein ACT016_30480, partial [Pseudomonas aeruginosa]
MSDFEKQIGELNASLKQVGDQIKAQAEQVNTQIANFGEMNADSTPFGHSAHADPDTCSTLIRTGS